METSPELKVRPAVPDDAEALAGLFSELGFPTTPGAVTMRLAAAGPIGLVAVLDGRVVGVVTTNVMPVLHRPEPVGRISALVVAHAHRGLGIGRQLVAHAETLLAASGCGLVEVTSNMQLEQAHAFYRALGYVVTSYRFKKEVHGKPSG